MSIREIRDWKSTVDEFNLDILFIVIWNEAIKVYGI